MAIVKTSHVKTGMVLAKPVFGRKGVELFSAGESIEERHIKALKTWGITEINITSGDQSVLDDDDFEYENLSKEEKRALEKATEMFQYNDMENPHIRELFKITIDMILVNARGRSR